MEISHRATEALITGAVGVVAVVGVRMALDFSYNRYEKRLQRRDPAAVARHRTTFTFTRRVIVALVATVAVWSVLSLYDVTSEIAKALLASSAVLALFAGLAFSTPLSNLGSGLLVAFTQPLRLGDRITVGGETGFVEEMALIYTTLVTDDARRIFVPNTQLTTSMIVNRTIKDPRRAVTAHFPVSIATPDPRGPGGSPHRHLRPARHERRDRARSRGRDQRSHRLARGRHLRADRCRRRLARERAAGAWPRRPPQRRTPRRVSGA